MYVMYWAKLYEHQNNLYHELYFLCNYASAQNLQSWNLFIIFGETTLSKKYKDEMKKGQKEYPSISYDEEPTVRKRKKW